MSDEEYYEEEEVTSNTSKKGDGNFLKARQEAKKGELDEQLREYINEWRKQRSKEEEELKRLKEKQAKRKEIRAEQEKKLAQKKKRKRRRKRKRRKRKNNCLTTRLNSSTDSPQLHHLYQNRDHVISYLLEACPSLDIISYTWRHLKPAFKSCFSQFKHLQQTPLKPHKTVHLPRSALYFNTSLIFL